LKRTENCHHGRATETSLATSSGLEITSRWIIRWRVRIVLQAGKLSAYDDRGVSNAGDAGLLAVAAARAQTAG